jgi:hypothetical protein
MGALVLDQPGQRFGDAGILSSLPDEGDRVKGRDKVPPPEGKGELLVQYAAQDPSRLCAKHADHWVQPPQQTWGRAPFPGYRARPPKPAQDHRLPEEAVLDSAVLARSPPSCYDGSAMKWNVRLDSAALALAQPAPPRPAAQVTTPSKSPIS